LRVVAECTGVAALATVAPEELAGDGAQSVRGTRRAVRLVVAESAGLSVMTAAAAPKVLARNALGWRAGVLLGRSQQRSRIAPSDLVIGVGCSGGSSGIRRGRSDSASSCNKVVLSFVVIV